jgi:hypothetical protein
MNHIGPLYYHANWQNLDDREKCNLVEDALVTALGQLGAARDDNWSEVAAARQVFARTVRNRLGSGWQHGRASLYLYHGDPESKMYGVGRKLTTLGIQWSLLRRQWSTGISLNLGGGDGNADVDFSLRIPGFGMYLSAEDVLPFRFYNSGEKYPSEREVSISWFANAVRLKLWSDPDTWDNRGSLWDARSSWRRVSFNVIDVLLGRAKFREEVQERGNVILHMPEGDYQLAYVRTLCTWKRPRWPKPIIQVRYELTPSPALPIPGKGENAWDCDDDAIFGMTVNADTLEDAARSLVDSVCKTRLQYGGATWQPPEGWPV